MKHILLGTSALVAAGLMVAPAAAQEGVKLGLGGYYYGAAGGNIDESFDSNASARDYAFKQDLEVHAKGEATLDNGITVGARVEIEGQQSDDQIDEVWAYFSGGFGEVRFGDDDDAYAQLCYLVPTASGAFGADSPFLNFSNAGVDGYGATNGTCYGLSDNSTKLIYFSPSFGGFQLAASFAPENSEDRRNTQAGFGTADDQNGADPRGSIENIWSAAATYTTEIDAFSVAVGGGAAGGSREDVGAASNPCDDPLNYNGYVQVGFAGWTIGGATEYRDNAHCSFGEDAKNWVYGVGTTYGFEAWTVGLGWTHGDYEDVVAADTKDKYDIVQFTAAYALGPGVTVDALVGWNNYNSDGGDDYDGVEAGVGFGIAF